MISKKNLNTLSVTLIIITITISVVLITAMSYNYNLNIELGNTKVRLKKAEEKLEKLSDNSNKENNSKTDVSEKIKTPCLEKSIYLKNLVDSSLNIIINRYDELRAETGDNSKEKLQKLTQKILNLNIIRYKPIEVFTKECNETVKSYYDSEIKSDIIKELNESKQWLK